MAGLPARPRAARPAHDGRRHRCVRGKPKITRHDVVADTSANDLGPSASSSSYAERECARCLLGRVYDERAGWVAYGVCSATGRATVFVYDQARRRSRSPRGGDLEHVGSVLACIAFVGSCAVCGASGTYTELHSVPEDRLTFFEGDLLCGECASAHGVL